MSDPRCKSCGRPLIAHLGVFGTCAQLQTLLAAANKACDAWIAHNDELLAPDLSNHYTARQKRTDYALAMLQLQRTINEIEK